MREISFNKPEYATYYGRDGKVRCELIAILTELEKIVVKIRNDIKELDCEYVLKNGLLELDNKELQEQIIKELEKDNAQNYVPSGKKLYFPHAYGTSAYDIYLKLCGDDFRFKKVLAPNFKIQEILFANNATPENYDVWFIAHSNWNGSQTNKWYNEIEGDGDYLTEHFLDTHYEFDSFPKAKYDRLVFVKMYNNQYVFFGLYKQILVDGMTKTRRYQRLSKEYPI